MPSNPFEYASGMRDKITAKESQEIQQMYVELGKKIDALGKKYGKKDTASAPLQQMYYTQLKKQVEAWSKELSNGVYSKVTHAIGSVSDAVVKDNAKWLESFGFDKDHISAAFSNVNQSVVNSIVTGKIYGNKSGSWSLSKSIWGDNEKNLKTIYRIVAEGMTMQMGVQEIAENLRDFVDPTKKLDWTGPDGAKIYGRKTDYNAQRLVRTLSQHAYQKSVSQVAWDNPFISKIKWVANGSRVCEICKKRNGKVYALSKLPLDHPNGMCVMDPVIDDDITDQLADWVKGKETKKTKGIGKFADLLGYDKDELAKSLLKSTGKPKAGIADKAKNAVKENVKSTLAENEDEFNKWFSEYKKKINAAIDSGDYIQLIDSLSDKVHNEIGKTVEKYFDELYDHDYFTNEDFVKYLLSDDVIDGIDVSSVENKVKKLFESETGKKLGDIKGSIFNKVAKSGKLEKVASAAKKADVAMQDMIEKYANKIKTSTDDFLFFGKMSKENMLDSLYDDEIEDIAQWMAKNYGSDISTGSKKDKAVLEWMDKAFSDVSKMDYDKQKMLGKTNKVSNAVEEKAVKAVKKKVIKNTADDDKLLSNLLDKFKNQTTDKMLSIGGKALDGLTEEQFEVLKSYTGDAYTEINDYFRKTTRGERPSAWLDKDTIDSIEDTVKAFSNIKTKEDYALRRGTDANDIFYTFLSGNPSMKEKINSLVTSLEDDLFAPGGGVNEANLQKHIDEISSLIKGQTGNFASFTSTSSSWDKGFKGDVEYVIDAPKGTAGTSIMSISNYGISEGEFLLAPGTKVICTKVEAARDGHKRALVKVFLKVLV